MPADAVDAIPPYSLQPDRCVIEVSLRLLGLRLVRARLRPRAGTVTLSADRRSAAITAEAMARPERIGPPVLGALLVRAVSRAMRLTFTAADVDLTTRAGVGWPVPIAASVRGYVARAAWSLPLVARVLELDEERLLLAVRGPVRRPGARSLPPRSWTWVEAAAEFAR